MVKCLIRISTRVNVHLRMINHCYRDVKVRVLSLGPRLFGKALGVLPLYPAITSQEEPLQAFHLPITPQPSVISSTSSGLESQKDSAFPTSVGSSSYSDSFVLASHTQINESSNNAEVIDDNFSPLKKVLPTPVTELKPESAVLTTRQANSSPQNTGEEKQAVGERGEPRTTESNTTVIPDIRDVKSANKFVVSVLYLLVVTIGLLFALLLLFIILTECDVDVAFLHHIRQTPEFEQFHYEYFCPLRRWFACKLHRVGVLLISK